MKCNAASWAAVVRVWLVCHNVNDLRHNVIHQVDAQRHVPELTAVIGPDDSGPVVVTIFATSYAFLVLPDAGAEACEVQEED